MKLSELLTPERIRIPLTAHSKDDVLRELVSLLGKSAESSREILDAVREREERMCTGIGRGIAIPHGKSAHALGLEVAFGLAGTPVDYGALDRAPVRAFFLLVSSPDSPDAHLRALGRISRLLSSDEVQEELFEATSASQVLDLLRKEEANGDGFDDA